MPHPLADRSNDLVTTESLIRHYKIPSHLSRTSRGRAHLPQPIGRQLLSWSDVSGRRHLA
jgi:hypothetical protein